MGFVGIMFMFCREIVQSFAKYILNNPLAATLRVLLRNFKPEKCTFHSFSKLDGNNKGTINSGKGVKSL